MFATVDVSVSSFVTGKLQRPSPEMLKKFPKLFFFLLAGNSKKDKPSINVSDKCVYFSTDIYAAL